ncbi:MAG: hypothetical protein U0522_01595 [Candidatus Paceibacterota bacterium]
MTVSKINFSCLTLSNKNIHKKYRNKPRCKKYHRPDVLVSTDQKDVCRLNPKNAETTIDKKYRHRARKIGDFGIETCVFFIKTERQKTIDSIIEIKIRKADLTDVPLYKKYFVVTKGKDIKNM